jgi:hypothetical protein
VKSALLYACTAVNVYVLLASLYLALVLYPRFAQVAPGEWSSTYHAFTQRNGVVFVPWELLAFVLALVLYFARPEGVPAWVVHVAVGCGAIYFAITFGWHLPVHRDIETHGNEAARLAPLLTSHWLRTAIEVPRVAALVWAATTAWRS